jgi:cytochrome c peroxidase
MNSDYLSTYNISLTMIILASLQNVVPPAVALGVCLYSVNHDHTSEASSNTDLAKIKKAIENLIEADSEKRADGTSLTGTFVRLAWHCAGTYSMMDGSGGSNGGRMRFDPERSWGANAGLGIARDALESVKVCRMQ